MAKIEIKYEPRPLGKGSEKYYLSESGAIYRRIVGAIAWARGDKPGFAVVLGEERTEDPALKINPLRLLAEHENSSAGDLIKRCSDFQGQFQGERWLGDDQHRGMMEVLGRQNNELNQKVYISPAPFLGDAHALEFYLSSIRERTQSNKKSLFFGQNSQLPSALNTLPADKLTTSAADFPPVAALGYAVSCLDVKPYDNTEHEAIREEYIAARDRAGI